MVDDVTRRGCYAIHPEVRKILVAMKAAHHRQPRSFGDMVLIDRGFATEIAQCPLGDLTFKVRYLHWTKRFAQERNR